MMRAAPGLLVLLALPLAALPAHADAGADQAFKVCAERLSKTYSTPRAEIARLKVESRGGTSYEVSGHATYNGETHAVVCSVKDGLVKWVTWS